MALSSNDVLNKLFEITETQKTIRTTKLKVMLKVLAKIYRSQESKIRNQKRSIEKINKAFNQQKTKAHKKTARNSKLEKENMELRSELYKLKYGTKEEHIDER